MMKRKIVGLLQFVGWLSFAGALCAQPPAPNITGLAPISSSEIQIGWSYGGATPQGFDIERSINSFTTTLTTSGTASSLNDGGLSGNAWYSYRMRAVLGNNSYSPWSGSASVQTPLALVRGVNYGGEVDAIAVDVLPNGKTNVYVGGHFSQAGGAVVGNIAIWHPEISAWSDFFGWSLDRFDGVGRVYAITVDPITHDVYVGGQFTSARYLLDRDVAEIPLINVVKWQFASSSWSNMGGGVQNYWNTGYVKALLFSRTNYLDGQNASVTDVTIYAGGCFTNAGPMSSQGTGGLAVTNIAAWREGVSWNHGWFAMGTNFTGEVNAIADGDGPNADQGFRNVYAGGWAIKQYEEQSGPKYVGQFAWGAPGSWHFLGNNSANDIHDLLDGPVNALEYFDGKLYIGGSFGGNVIVNPPSLNGALYVWDPVQNTTSGLLGQTGSGTTTVFGKVRVLKSHRGKILVGGEISYNGTVSGNPSKGIFGFDPTSQQFYHFGDFNTGEGMNGVVFAIGVNSADPAVGSGANVYAGGDVPSTWDNPCLLNIARWHDTHWYAMPNVGPSISITSPANNSNVEAGNNVDICFNVSDDCIVSTVKVYDGDFPIGTVTVNSVPGTTASPCFTAVLPSIGQHYYYVETTDCDGIEVRSPTVQVNVSGFAGPSGLTATSVLCHYIQLNWTDNSQSETGFTIQRKVGANGSFSDLASVNGNVTTYSDFDVQPGPVYYYQVRATKPGGVVSKFSNVASTSVACPLGPPNNLIATVLSSSAVRITWQDNSSDETGFVLERQIGTGAFAPIATPTVGAGVTTYNDTGLQPETHYCYRVKAINGSGESTYSNVGCIDTPKQIPTGGNCFSTPSGLVGWWPGDGNSQDIIAHNNGAAYGYLSYEQGITGQAFRLDGSSATYISIGVPAALKLQNFTVETWVKRGSIDQASQHIGSAKIFGYGTGGYALGLEDDGTPFLASVGIDRIHASFQITDLTYHHLAVTKDGNSVVFYLDGAGTAAQTYDTVFTFTTSVGIGRDSGAILNSFFGSVDELAVYNRALSATEILGIYSAGTAGKCKPTVCTPPPAGIVSWWPGNGNIQDIIGEHNGSLAGGVTYTLAKVGPGFHFNGNDAGIYVGNPLDFQLQTLTIETWVRLDSLSGNTEAIFAYGQDGYVFGVTVNGNPFLGKSGVSQVECPTAISIGQFHHLAVTKNGGTVVFYIDGNAYPLSDSYDPGFAFTSIAAIGFFGDMTTGCGDAPLGLFKGDIDELSIYNRALGAAEIQSIFAAGSEGKCPPIVPNEPPVDPWLDEADSASFGHSAFHYTTYDSAPWQPVWAWTDNTVSPAPYSGNQAHGENAYTGSHFHWFGGSASTMHVNAKDTLYAYVYLDPANPPTEVMLQWQAIDGTRFEHRAYWGADSITDWGTTGTASRMRIGDLPAAGKWVRLEVPASLIDLDGRTVSGMAFNTYGGKTKWDAAGKQRVWIEDENSPSLLHGFYKYTMSGTSFHSGSWPWRDNSASPAPDSGSQSHGDDSYAGVHQHWFGGTTETLYAGEYDLLYAYVYLDPSDPPTEIMLQWESNDGSGYEHRAYWGANNITAWGTDGTPSRQHIGDLPATGKWIRLEVPASTVGLNGRDISGMAFGAYGGKVTWDQAGKIQP